MPTQSTIAHEFRGRKWRTVAQWKDFGGEDGQMWCTDLEWFDVRSQVWHADAFMTYQEEMHRGVPESITKASQCRIYVASLSDYNSGRLLGEWIDVGSDADAIRDQIKAMLATSKEEVAEEYAIHDHEGFPPAYVQEYSDIDELVTMAELIEEHGMELVTAAMECTGSHECSDIESTIECQCGFFGRGGLADWAQGQCEDCDDGSLKNLPQFIACHIDWSRLVMTCSTTINGPKSMAPPTCLATKDYLYAPARHRPRNYYQPRSTRADRSRGVVESVRHLDGTTDGYRRPVLEGVGGSSQGLRQCYPPSPRRTSTAAG